MDKTVHIHELWGADLSGRTLGAIAREELERMVDEGPATVIIDLTGVEAMSTSFADECFGALVRAMRAGKSTRLRFIGGNEDVRAVLRSVLARPSGRSAMPA
jgi:anti-anti-sigma regulatory factor